MASEELQYSFNNFKHFTIFKIICLISIVIQIVVEAISCIFSINFFTAIQEYYGDKFRTYEEPDNVGFYKTLSVEIFVTTILFFNNFVIIFHLFRQSYKLKYTVSFQIFLHAGLVITMLTFITQDKYKWFSDSEGINIKFCEQKKLRFEGQEKCEQMFDQFNTLSSLLIPLQFAMHIMCFISSFLITYMTNKIQEKLVQNYGKIIGQGSRSSSDRDKNGSKADLNDSYFNTNNNITQNQNTQFFNTNQGLKDNNSKDSDRSEKIGSKNIDIDKENITKQRRQRQQNILNQEPSNNSLNDSQQQQSLNNSQMLDDSMQADLLQKNKFKQQ